MFYASLKKRNLKGFKTFLKNMFCVLSQISLTSHMYSVQVEINIAKEEESSDKRSKFTFRISGF